MRGVSEQTGAHHAVGPEGRGGAEVCAGDGRVQAGLWAAVGARRGAAVVSPEAAKHVDLGFHLSLIHI